MQTVKDISFLKKSETAKTGNIRQSFETEKQLVEVFIKKFRSNLSSSQKLFTEIDSGNGIVDILIAKKRNNPLQVLNIHLIQPRWMFLVVKLPYRKKFNLEDFMKLSGVSKNTSLDILKILVEAGVCIYNKELRVWKKEIQPYPLTQEIKAVEAKLRNWKRALRQAYQNLEYATESWVLLDKSQSKGALTNLDCFIKLNVGLMTIDDKAEIEIIHEPYKRKPKSPYRFWHVQSELIRCFV